VTKAINLDREFESISEHWKPKALGTLNGQPVRIVKLQGEFEWHKHDHADEFMLVMQGELVVRLRDGDVHIKERECCVVPRGIEHLTAAAEETQVLFIRPE
jgi:mannose-6-phosphate isomerase-like protein (cupin superfamily)